MSLGTIGKDKLIYDPAYPNDGDNVGIFLKSGDDGSPITSTDVSLFADYTGIPPGGATTVVVTADNPGPGGNITLTGDGTSTLAQLIAAWNLANPTNTVSLTTGDGSQIVTNGQNVTLSGGADKTGIDVNIVGGSIEVKVDLNGIYDAVNNPDPDNVGIVVFDRAVTPSTTGEKFLPTGGSLGNVAAGDVNKVHALDTNAFAMAYNATTGGWQSITVDPTTGGLNVSIEGIGGSASVADDDPDAGDPLKVGSRSRWGALAALSANNDRADLISDKYRRVYVNNGGNIGLKQQGVTVTTSAGKLITANLDGRRLIMIQNLSNKAIYIGKDASVTTTGATAGLRVAAGGVLNIDAGQDIDIYAIGEAASQDIRVLEMA